MRNIDLVHHLCDTYDHLQGQEAGSSRRMITYVQDRAGHDFRYAVDCTKIKSELGWTQATRIEDGLIQTVRWYLDNQAWLDDIKSGSYRKI